MLPVGMPLRLWSVGMKFSLGPLVITYVSAGMIKDGIDGVLILTDEDENLKEIAARFTKETGRPVWRELTEIPATNTGNKRS